MRRLAHPELTNFRTPAALVFLALKHTLEKFPPPRTPETERAAQTFMKTEVDRLRAERGV